MAANLAQTGITTLVMPESAPTSAPREHERKRQRHMETKVLQFQQYIDLVKRLVLLHDLEIRRQTTQRVVGA